MLQFIQSRRYTFKHNLNSTLLNGVAISKRRCLLFYSNKKYFNYDPFSKQIISEGILPEKPIKTILLNKSEVLCLLENGKLAKLNFEKFSLIVGCQLPPVKTDDTFLDKQVIFNSQIVVFNESGTYYIQLPYKQQNRRRIIYFPDPNSFQYNTIQFHSVEPICEKIDQISKLIIYYQLVQQQQEVEWDIKIVDLMQGVDRRIIVDNPILKPGTIVSKILMKNQTQLFFFINSPQPRLLLLQIQSLDMSQVNLKLKPNFIDVIFYERQKQIICLSFLEYTKINGQITDNVLEIIDLNTLKKVSTSNLSLKQISVPIQKDYILDFSMQGKPGNTTLFHSRHIIRNKALVFHIMLKNGMFSRFGTKIGKTVLSLFDE